MAPFSTYKISFEIRYMYMYVRTYLPEMDVAAQQTVYTNRQEFEDLHHRSATEEIVLKVSECWKGATPIMNTGSRLCDIANRGAQPAAADSQAASSTRSRRVTIEG